MLLLNQILPTGALIGSEGRALDAALARTSGARFIARNADLVQVAEVVTGWREASGATEALTTTPNTGNSRLEAGPPPSLRFETGVHCGFYLPDFAPVVDQFTAAVIYSSSGQARTLCSVSTGQSNNLIFLSESDNRIIAKDREGTVDLALDLPADLRKPHLAMLCYTGRALILRFDGRMVQAEGAIPGMDHPADFFIGCRSNRSGLTKTLGASRLHEVIFWPDRAILGASDPDDRAALETLDRYHRWTY